MRKAEGQRGEEGKWGGTRKQKRMKKGLRSSANDDECDDDAQVIFASAMFILRYDSLLSWSIIRFCVRWAVKEFR